ncbi:MAG TPA: 4-(cytidine 5'-diphospho)-2-C-methyl-D-erythritol kinase [Gaiellaceae bacterium]
MRAPAPAKINLALVVGPQREDGKHEVLTVLQRVGLSDRIDLEPAPATSVEGFPDDTLVRDALRLLGDRAGTSTGWHVRIEKKIAAAAGLGGGSSDAATALRLANAMLDVPLSLQELHPIAAQLGSDVPFFLYDGPQLASGDGAMLELLELPQDFFVVLVLPDDAVKSSTADVYAAFDARNGADGWDERRGALSRALEAVRRPRDLAALPRNDLAESPVSERLRDLGAFRADVSGAGPAVYGLFHHEQHAKSARRALGGLGRTWLTAPAWYG